MTCNKQVALVTSNQNIAGFFQKMDSLFTLHLVKAIDAA